jgi:hypothetical protein
MTTSNAKTLNPNPYMLPEDDRRFRSENHNNFWSKTNELQSSYDTLVDKLPIVGECKTPRMETFRLVCNMYYDLYNNGGGNSCRWAISKSFKSSIRKAKFSKEVVSHLEDRLSDVFEYVARGKNFGWPTDMSQCQFAVEKLMTDVVYHCGR